MLDFTNPVIRKVFNPLAITKNSLIEFTLGDLKEQGLFRFKKIIEINLGEKKYSRYLIFSNLENTEHVFEVFPSNNGILETYIYSLSDTIPFSEDFLDNVAGQRFLNTPQGNEYTRSIMPDNEDRIDGLWGLAKIYNIETNEIEKEYNVKFWDYQRDNHGIFEYLSLEMSDENGMFKIFTGELIEQIFYKFYQNTK